MTPYRGAMAHKLELAAMRRRDGYLFVSMLCPDCPGATFGSKIEDIHYDDHDAQVVEILKALASVQQLHDADVAHGRV